MAAQRGEDCFRARGARMSEYRWIGVGLLAVAIGLAVTDPAFAHTRSQSFSSWYIRDGQVWLSFTVQSLEATRLGLIEGDATDLNELLVKHLASRITVRADGEPCRTATGPQSRAAREGYVRVEWRFA